MSKETELRTFSRLAAGEQLAWGSVPKSVKNGSSLSELLATGVLTEVRRGAGQVLVVADPDALESFLDGRFPGRHTAEAGDGIGNVKRYRYSKGGKKESIGVVLLRGWQTISVNEEQVDLAYFTQRFDQEADFREAVRSHWIAPTDAAIEALLQGQQEELWQNFRKISQFQIDHLPPMVLPSITAIWQQGLASDHYLLKICGAGGGGSLCSGASIPGGASA